MRAFLRVIYKRPMPQSTTPERERAEDMAQAVALQALAFLAEDPARCARFLALTGLAVGDLRQRVAAREVHCAVLEHLAADESLLLAFSANAGIAPQRIAKALALLRGAQP
jgi:Protein of unknown function (DUF3572)